MAYAVGEEIPEALFVQLLTEKANMLRNHLKETHSSLVMCANIGLNMATFKLYNTKEEDSLKLHSTISNLGDIREQLYQIMDTAELPIMGIFTNCIKNFKYNFDDLSYIEIFIM